MVQVTVAVPVYNGADHLDQALESLARQTFPDVTFLVADNCSTDATWDIVQSWAARDARFSIHRHESNIGAVANFNWLLERAETPYFMFAAHDDWRSDNYVEALYRAITARPGLALAAPMVVKTNPEGQERQRTAFCGLNDSARIMRVARALRWAQSGWFYGLHWTQNLRDALKWTEAFSTAWGADYLTFVPSILADGVTGTNEAVFYQRETGLSASAYKPATLEAQYAFLKEFLGVCYRMLDMAPLNPIEKTVAALLLLRFANSNAWKFRRLLRSAILRPLRRTGRA